MRNKRAVIYGGTKLDRKTSDFTTRLACELLKNEHIMLATGGFLRAADQPPETIPTDAAVITGAELFAKKHGVLLEACLEILRPEPTKDRTDEGVERFREGKILPGLSAQARLAVTEYQAVRWERFSVAVANPESEATCLKEIARAVNGVIRRSCLVLMPFKDELGDLYSALKNIIDDEGFHPVRLDRDLYADDVRETVRRLLRECDAIVADVTDRSPNVMYEVGLAHAYGREPLLLWRGDGLADLLPFYLRPQRIVSVTDPADMRGAIKAYLARVTSGSDRY